MRRVLAATIALGGVLTACQLILGIEREPGALLAVAPGVEAGPDVATPGLPPCIFAAPPTMPASSPEPPLDAIFFAVSEFRFKRTAEVRGYDLDGFCTGEDASPNGSPCKPGKSNVVDQDGGVDNASSTIQLFALDAPANNLNSQLAKKTFTVLIQLTEYNGLPNDDFVNLAVISGTGRNTTASCAGGPLTDAATGECPDTWDYPTAETPLRPGQPVFKGWVRDGFLVARGSGQLQFGFGQSTLGLGSPIVTAKLVARDGTFAIVDGLITGRAAISNLLGVIGAFDIEGFGGRICGQDSGIGPLARQSICDARDLMSVPDAEPTAAQCDAISFVMGFDAVRALTGTTKELPQVSPCPEDFLRCPD